MIKYQEMDTLKRRHPIPQTPDSPPPKYSDTYEPIPLSDAHYQPTISEKHSKVYKTQTKYTKVRLRKINLKLATEHLYRHWLL
jgi:hypothetical protein